MPPKKRESFRMKLQRLQEEPEKNRNIILAEIAARNWASDTDEHREARLQKQREQAAAYKASETAEQREARLKYLRERVAAYKASETAESREARLKDLRDRAAAIRASMPEEDPTVWRRKRKPKVIRPKKKKPFKCDTCGNDFNQESTFQLHLQSHTLKTFSCETCLSVFPTSGSLQKHCLMKHQKKVKRIYKKRPYKPSKKTVEELVIEPNLECFLDEPYESSVNDQLIEPKVECISEEENESNDVLIKPKVECVLAEPSEGSVNDLLIDIKVECDLEEPYESSINDPLIEPKVECVIAEPNESNGLLIEPKVECILAEPDVNISALRDQCLRFVDRKVFCCKHCGKFFAKPNAHRLHELSHDFRQPLVRRRPAYVKRLDALDPDYSPNDCII